MIRGFDFVGVTKESPSLPPDFQDHLLATSEPSNRAIIHSTKSSGSKLIDAELFAKTREEVDKGWLDGPLSNFPERGRISRRFAVVQSDNDAVNVTNRCTVDGADSISATAVSFIRDLHARGESGEGILGMTFDLKSAYRTLAASDESLRWARLAVFNPHKKSTELYQQNSLRCKGLCDCFHPLCQDDLVACIAVGKSEYFLLWWFCGPEQARHREQHWEEFCLLVGPFGMEVWKRREVWHHVHYAEGIGSPVPSFE